MTELTIECGIRLLKQMGFVCLIVHGTKIIDSVSHFISKNYQIIIQTFHLFFFCLPNNCESISSKLINFKIDI